MVEFLTAQSFQDKTNSYQNGRNDAPRFEPNNQISFAWFIPAVSWLTAEVLQAIAWGAAAAGVITWIATAPQSIKDWFNASIRNLLHGEPTQEAQKAKIGVFLAEVQEQVEQGQKTAEEQKAADEALSPKEKAELLKELTDRLRELDAEAAMLGELVGSSPDPTGIVDNLDREAEFQEQKELTERGFDNAREMSEILARLGNLGY
jgi:hypothetical protein